MAVINVDSEGVRAIMAEVSTSYDSFKAQVENMLATKDNVCSYWDSDEATSILNALGEISTSFTNFYEKHADVLSSMRSMMSAVDELQASQDAKQVNFAGGGTGSN